MALNITGNVELGGGITIPSCYGRTFYQVYIESKEVQTMIQYFASETAYNEGKGMITPHIKFIGRYPYDRDVDGVDVLEFTQIKAKEELENLGFSVEITGV